MNIYLFDENRIITFELPIKKIGNFWLKDENNKNAVNIYAENGQWLLKPSKISEISDAEGNRDNIVLQPKKFYGVKINDKKFIMMSDYFSDSSYNYFSVIPGTIIFGALVVFAILVNIIGYYAWFGTPNNTTGQKLFFLYLSPWYENPFPILGTIKEQVPYPIFLLAYLAAFALGITILWLAIFGIKKLVQLIKDKKKA